MPAQTRATVWALLAIVLSLTAPPPALCAEDYVPGEVLVCYRAGLVPEELRAAASPAGALLPGLRRLRVPAGERVEAAVEDLSRDPRVAWAEPNYAIHAEGSLGGAGLSAEDVWPSEPEDIPGAWALRQVHAPAAWEMTQGSPEVVVALVDSGVCLDHPELAGNLFTNKAERADGRDNDNNGYVDDLHGWDFLDSDPQPADTYGHGTFIAGLIGAAGNNGEGIVGVNWRVSLLPLRVMDETGRGNVAVAVEAINYALQMGARVINLSWGAGGESRALQDVLAAAGRAGVIVICSAGNDGEDGDVVPHYPSGYELDNIVAVAASGPEDVLLSNSNYGLHSVDVAAPGTALFSTALGGGYTSGSGTSFSAALVSGVAALTLSYEGYRHLSVAELRSRLLDTADPSTSLDGYVASGGRVDAARALCCLAPVQAVLRVGQRLPFHLPGGCQAYAWELSNPNLGRINNGVLEAQAAGRVLVMATPREGGEPLSTGTIEILTKDGDPGDDPEGGGDSSPKPASSTGGGGGGCFIATAAWSPQAAEVRALRGLRDHWLLRWPPGRAAVALYYEFSPPLAKYLGGSPPLRALVRLMLQPLAWLAGLVCPA